MGSFFFLFFFFFFFSFLLTLHIVVVGCTPSEVLLDIASVAGLVQSLRISTSELIDSHSIAFPFNFSHHIHEFIRLEAFVHPSIGVEFLGAEQHSVEFLSASQAIEILPVSQLVDELSVEWSDELPTGSQYNITVQYKGDKDDLVVTAAIVDERILLSGFRPINLFANLVRPAEIPNYSIRRSVASKIHGLFPQQRSICTLPC
jgi:hypothetical protein